MNSKDRWIFWVFLPSSNLKTLILLSVLVYSKVLGLEIDIRQVSSKIHCIPSNEPLQLLNPFPELLGSDHAAVITDQNFISMEWSVSKPGQSEVVIITIITNPEVITPKYAAYKFWNLQINNVEADDTATYTARLTFTKEKKTKDFNLTIAKTPVLKSDKITVAKQGNDGKVTHKCGEIADLGIPPINFYWKSVRDGSILPGDYIDGFLTITLPESEDVTCEFNKSSTATACIPQTEMGRWEGTSAGTLSAGSDDSKYIIIGCIAGGIILGLILIIVLVILIIRKRKGKNYNAKKEEAKVEEQSETNFPLVDRSFDENDSHRKPIYRGPPESPSPRTRTKANNNSRVQEASDNGDYEEYSANGKAPAVPPKYRKKGEVKEDGDLEEKRPPKVKPRSIFLTPSMEELDKINTAVAGGKGSEPRDTARRGSEPWDNEPRDTAQRGGDPRDTARRGGDTRDTARRGGDPRDTARRGSEPLDKEPRDNARRGTESRDTGRKGTESRDTGRRGTEPRGSESKGPAPRGTLV